MEESSCGKKFLFLRKKTGSKFLYAFLPALCKSWSCKICRSKKAGIVRKFIKTKFSGQPLWMLSITFFHTGSPEDEWRSLGEKCNRLLTYARKYSGAFDYLRVVEPHADGLWPHIHILCTKPIATERFVKLLTQWGFGWNFHSAPIDIDRCADYVSKYLTKEWPAGDADLMRIIYGTRIVSCNRNLGAIFTKESEWICVNYDKPSDHAEYLHSLTITELQESGCTYVLSRSFSTGFIIESDVRLSSEFIDKSLEPYIWRVSDSYDYEFIPYGLQEEISF